MRLRLVVPIVFLACWIAAAVAQTQPRTNPVAEEERRRHIDSLRERNRAARQKAHQLAREKGWRIRSEKGEREFELIGMRNGRPVYVIANNKNAAISTAADQVHSPAPYGLSGAGVTVGVWDAGEVLTTHREFGSRVVIRETAELSVHATHVAGTIGASGVDANAKGMAAGATMDSYHWDNDVASMTMVGATGASQSNRLYLSNHSYGIVAGWDYVTNASGEDGVHWHGDLTPTNKVDPVFGQYNIDAAEWDEVVYNAPYFLPFKSVENNRDDNPPAPGTPFYYFSGDDWTSKTYNAATDPPSDAAAGGYNSITDASCSKNVLTVGNVQDAVSGGVRSLAGAVMTSTSGWGPTDDGRIKPDVVANGYNVYSATDSANDAYGIRSGASMAAANATGSAALLVEYYERLFSSSMLASTLKALILHTADDLGNAGPDYSHGWGLINVKSAADQMKSHSDRLDDHYMTEGILIVGNGSESFDFWWDGASPIRATLSWADPPGVATFTHDDATPVLVNDLDLRITHSVGPTTFMPFVLDPANRSAAATAGDNTLDNVEQIRIASPPSSGFFTATVSHKGTLTNNAQRYSLILSGQISLPDISVSGGPLDFGDQLAGTASANAQSVTIRNDGTADMEFTGITIAGADAAQFAFADSPSTALLSPGQSRTVDVVFSPSDPAGIGNQSASLDIVTNDPDEGTVQVALSGNGVSGSLPSAEFEIPATNMTESDQTLPIEVSLNEPAGSGGVTLWYRVLVGSTATGNGADYTLTVPGSLSIPAGESSDTISVQINEDSIDEEDQTIILQLTNPSGAMLGAQGIHTITIADDDDPPSVSFSSAEVKTNETDRSTWLTVSLFGNATEKTVQAQVASSNDTATAGEDYTALSQTVTISPPSRSAQVRVIILNDGLPEVTERFLVRITGTPTNAALAAPSAVTVEIEDDEIVPPPEAGVWTWILY